MRSLYRIGWLCAVAVAFGACLCIAIILYRKVFLGLDTLVSADSEAYIELPLAVYGLLFWTWEGLRWAYRRKQ